MKRAILAVALLVSVSASASVSEQYVSRLADAIKLAENSQRYPYGIIAKHRLSESEARRWCSNTIRHQYAVWERSGSKGEFLVHLAGVYCPVGASNDRKYHLNQYWLANVRRLMR